jgi:hypothetical protein
MLFKSFAGGKFILLRYRSEHNHPVGYVYYCQADLDNMVPFMVKEPVMIFRVKRVEGNNTNGERKWQR